MRSAAAALLIVLATAPAAHAAADPACKPIIDSDKARAAAPAWHTRKDMAGKGMEIIRLGADVYANLGGTGWRKMPPGMAAQVTDAGNQADKFTVTECKKFGKDVIGGIATTVYTFKTIIADQPPFNGKVWIGNDDGLPYREEGDRMSGTTRYTDVTAPELAK